MILMMGITSPRVCCVLPPTLRVDTLRTGTVVMTNLWYAYAVLARKLWSFISPCCVGPRHTTSRNIRTLSSSSRSDSSTPTVPSRRTMSRTSRLGLDDEFVSGDILRRSRCGMQLRRYSRYGKCRCQRTNMVMMCHPSPSGPPELRRTCRYKSVVTSDRQK